MNLSVEQKQTHRLRNQVGDCQGEGGERKRDRLDIWGQQMQTITFRVDE